MRQSVAWVLIPFAAYIVYNRYIRQNDKYKPLPTSFEPYIDVPIIDISAFYDASSANNQSLKQDISKQIADASIKYGSFYISIPTHSSYNNQYRQHILSNAHKLFSVSPKIKESLSVNANSSRGFILYGKEFGSTQYFEHKEGFSYGYYKDFVPQNDMESLNRFPAKSAEIQQSFELLFDIFVDVSYALISAYSIALYQDERLLFDEFNGGETISIVRLFHYFGIKAQQQNKKNYLDHQSKMNAGKQQRFDLNLSFGAYIKEKWKQVTVS